MKVDVDDVIKITAKHFRKKGKIYLYSGKTIDKLIEVKKPNYYEIYAINQKMMQGRTVLRVHRIYWDKKENCWIGAMGKDKYWLLDKDGKIVGHANDEVVNLGKLRQKGAPPTNPKRITHIKSRITPPMPRLK